MKNLIDDIREHFYVDFEKRSYFYIIFLAILLISINYTFNFEIQIIRKSFGKPIGYLVYTLYYAIPYYLAIVPFLVLRKQAFKLQNKEFWIKSSIFLMLLGIFASFDHHHLIVHRFTNNPNEIKYLGKLVSFLKRILPYLLILFIIFLIYDKNKKNFYGLRFNGFDYKPFIYISLLIVPFVLFASFLPGIQNYYPQFKYWNYQPVFNLNKLEMNLLFIFCYTVDFVGIELFFRGALVIGFISIIGREAILPMALLYIVIHFGKPLGEAISSFFGAYFLGIIAYNYKNIMGGIILHIILAWLMELTALLQHLRLFA